MHLLEHLATLFPGLALEPPLFYNWPIALRFELGSEDPHLTYDEVVQHRATTLYEAAFAATDLTFILGIYEGHTGLRSNKRRTRSIFELSREHGLALGRPSGTARVCFLENPSATARWAEVAPRAIHYPAIFRAIAAHDYIARNKLTDRVFFVNLTRGLILHMYDDRGLDLIATTRAALQSIYDAHKAWLLPDDERTADFRQRRLRAVDFSVPRDETEPTSC